MAEKHPVSHSTSKRLATTLPQHPTFSPDLDRGEMDQPYPETILHLQRVIGNQATLQRLRRATISTGETRGARVIQRGNSGNAGMTDPDSPNEKKPMKIEAPESEEDKGIPPLAEGTTFMSGVPNAKKVEGKKTEAPQIVDGESKEQPKETEVPQIRDDKGAKKPRKMVSQIIEDSEKAPGKTEVPEIGDDESTEVKSFKVVGTTAELVEEFMLELPLPFRNKKNSAEIKKMLQKERNPKDKKRLLKQVYRNVMNVMECLRKDADVLMMEFGIDVASITVTFSGSDFHNGGQQVLFIKSDTGTVVYKPRTTSPDNNLGGNENSVLSELNKMNPEGTQLPTMKFVERGGDSSSSKKNTSQQTHSYVEYQKHTQERSDEQTEAYYRQIGAMAVVAKLTGTNDLHQENVMSTADGPKVIDGETSFLPSIMFGSSFDHTIFSLVANIPSNISGFTTNGLSPKDLKHLNNPKYKKAFLEGAQEVFSLINAKKAEITQLLIDKMKATKGVRLVPLGTGTFGGAIQQYRNGDHAVVKGLYDQLVTKSTPPDLDPAKFNPDQNGFVAKGYQVYPECTAFILQGLEHDMVNGDIPIFHYEPAINRVLYHGKPIGYCIFLEHVTLEKFVEQHVNQMLKSGVEGLLKDFRL